MYAARSPDTSAPRSYGEVTRTGDPLYRRRKVRMSDIPSDGRLSSPVVRDCVSATHRKYAATSVAR